MVFTVARKDVGRGIYHALLKKGKDWVAYFPLLEIRKDFITLIIIVLVHVIHIIIFPLVHPSVLDEPKHWAFFTNSCFLYFVMLIN